MQLFVFEAQRSVAIVDLKALQGEREGGREGGRVEGRKGEEGWHI